MLSIIYCPRNQQYQGRWRSRNLSYYCPIKLTARLIEVNFNPFLSYILYKFKINKFHVLYCHTSSAHRKNKDEAFTVIENYKFTEAIWCISQDQQSRILESCCVSIIWRSKRTYQNISEVHCYNEDKLRNLMWTHCLKAIFYFNSLLHTYIKRSAQ